MLETSFHGITINFSEHWASITTNEKLMTFLAQPGNGSVELARYILNRYQEIFHRNLEIPEMSLAVEILVHAYLDVFSKNASLIRNLLPKQISKPILQLTEEIHERTSIIDCGEISVDHNRFIFNNLAPFHSLIFAALGKLS
ncbi:hypothetical protein [Caproicibacter sp.]|uniref:hypothetical protein n=1 Tax=Caproicibacter sp. TaxID=2814884 RepID=UPI003989DC09